MDTFEVRENGLQHVHGAADRGDCHLFAGRARTVLPEIAFG